MSLERKEQQRLYRQANREKRAEYNRQWAQRNPGKVVALREAKKEAKREYDKAYRAANKSKLADQSKAWARKHPEQIKKRRAKRRRQKRDEILQYMKSWHEQNPDARPVYSAKRRAAKLTAHTVITRQEIAQLKEAAGGLCAYCLGTSTQFEIEHCTPLIRGGAHDLSNLVLACRSCNRSKSTKTVLEFVFGLAAPPEKGSAAALG